MAGRPHFLSDPDNCQMVAEAFAAGASRMDMCGMFGVSDPKTITRWRRDPRVKVILRKLNEDRTLRIQAKIDAKIEAMLEDEDLTAKDLVMIRKEFVGGNLRSQIENVVDDTTVGEAMDFAESNPDAVEQLQALLAGRKSE